MSKMDYSKEMHVNVSPNLVFKAITTEIDKWWSVHSNIADKLGDNLTVRFGETTVKEMLVSRLTESQELIWKVTKAFIDVDEFSKKDEWVGTEIQWEITPLENGTRIYFVHKGLTPAFECYNACKGGWNFFLESLKNYLETGKGSPHGTEQES